MTKRHEFKGFEDLVEICRAGKHAESQGRTQSWSRSDLNKMVKKHTESIAAPTAIGHLEANDPAFGWFESLERKGKSLFAKF
jgi:hypothetical protein